MVITKNNLRDLASLLTIDNFPIARGINIEERNNKKPVTNSLE